MAVKKLSAIASGTAPATTDQVVGVQGGTTDVLFTFAQIATEVLGGTAFAGFAYTNATGQLALSGVAAGATTVLLVNPASASGLLADFQVGGTSKVKLGSNGGISTDAGLYRITNAATGLEFSGDNIGFRQNSSVYKLYILNGTGTILSSQSALGWSQTSDPTQTLDTFLSRDAANIVALTAGGLSTSASPTSLRIYHDDSSSGSVYSRMAIGFHTSHPTVASIDVESFTSTLPGFGIYVGSSTAALSISTGGAVTVGPVGGLLASGGIRAGSGTLIGVSWIIGQVGLPSTGVLGWSTTADGSTGTYNTVLTSPGAANVQFGAANVNGAPVAQTISFQGALAASATNTASANTTIIGSLGTGTGTNGDIIFQTGVKTSTGTAQATATTALTIKGETGQVQISQGGAATAPALFFRTDSSQTGFFASLTNFIGIAISGGTLGAFVTNGLNFPADGTKAISWGTIGGTQSSALYSDTANIVSLSNVTNGGTTATAFRVYNTSSSSNSNYERGVFGWTDTGNVLTIGTQSLGAGVLRSISMVGTQVNFMNGTNVVPAITVGDAGTGFYRHATNAIGVSFGTTVGIRFEGAANGLQFLTGYGLGFSASGTFTMDTSLYRSGVGILSIGSGANSGSAGSLVLTNLTSNGLVLTKASATGGAGFNLPSGTAPTSPNDGDLWYDGTNLKVRLAGATKTITAV